MTTLTLHALDERLAVKLRSKAKREKKSLNRAAQELLAQALGVTPSKPQGHRAEFQAFCGIWTEKEAREFDLAIEPFSRIDEGLWK